MNAVTDAVSAIEAFPVRTPSMLVYLNSGEVVPVAPATGLRVDAGDIVILMEDAEVARFPRSSVYFCSDAPISPPAFA